MPLMLTLTLTDDRAEIVLTGDLDATSAPQFQAELEKAATAKPKHLVLHLAALEFMASAGVRMLIFAKQKMGTGTRVYVIAPQEPILQTLQRTGLMNSVTVQDVFLPLT